MIRFQRNGFLSLLAATLLLVCSDARAANRQEDLSQCEIHTIPGTWVIKTNGVWVKRYMECEVKLPLLPGLDVDIDTFSLYACPAGQTFVLIANDNGRQDMVRKGIPCEIVYSCCT